MRACDKNKIISYTGMNKWYLSENTYFGKNMDTGTKQIATLTRIILSRLLLF